MPGSSLLTSGLESLADQSPAIQRMLKELIALDNVLQDAHRAAKADDENGERVVQAYEALLQHRTKLIAQLEKEHIAVPWQLRMRIDDIELTLRQRKAQKETATSGTEKRPEKLKEEKETTEETKDDDPLVLLKAMILPSAFIGVIGCVIYGVTSFAT